MARNKIFEHDEFYTRMETVKSELDNYSESFKGKTIYLNCDRPHISEFWNYFEGNFGRLGLKMVFATYYGGDSVTVLDRDGERRYRLDNDGGFQSNRKLIDYCDIIVSNPPFSMMKEYMQICIGSGKGYLILGPAMEIGSKFMFDKWKNSEMNLGTTVHGSGLRFNVPDGFEKSKYNPQCNWYTNLKPDKGKEYRYAKPVANAYGSDRDKYVKFRFKVEGEYEDVLFVPTYKVIPADYDGWMAVSKISFLERCSPEDFDIEGIHTVNIGGKKQIVIIFRNKDNGVTDEMRSEGDESLKGILNLMERMTRVKM